MIRGERAFFWRFRVPTKWEINTRGGNLFIWVVLSSGVLGFWCFDDFYIYRFLNFSISVFVDFWIYWFMGFSISVFLEFWIYGFADFWISGCRGFSISGFADSWIMWYLDFWSSGFVYSLISMRSFIHSFKGRPKLKIKGWAAWARSCKFKMSRGLARAERSEVLEGWPYRMNQKFRGLKWRAGATWALDWSMRTTHERGYNLGVEIEIPKSKHHPG